MKFVMDISGVTALTNLSRKQFMGAAERAATAMSFAVYNQIHKEADGVLNSTRQIYKRNISQPVMGRLMGTITLTGQLPNMLEQGASAFDLKQGFARSQKVKKSKGGGWYLTIPFRHASAGAVGDSSAFSGGVMPSEIYNIAKALKASITVPFIGTVNKGGTISKEDLASSKFGVINTRKGIHTGGTSLDSNQGAAYKHKSSIYQGVGKSKAFYQKTSSSQYTSFRRVSDKSAPNSWIHKGLKARGLFKKALNNADLADVVSREITGYLRSQGL